MGTIRLSDTVPANPRISAISGVSKVMRLTYQQQNDPGNAGQYHYL